ncbi:hypothetical protein ACG83_38570 [Frankia sp. R43]|uniref:hypothetical protein n=1 Tax=Frankia sp. R43 TaxID=269536 RepID=UPI0006CA440C|nr:hypothetical protein [Frankia sp. R43]KPM50696.1 hypothetical protein ACG83_38570 [Frankia sp. R43]
MGIAIVDAVKLAKDNKRSYEQLEVRQQRLATRMAAESEAQQRARAEVYDQALVSFQDVFSRLKNVDLTELAEISLRGGEELPAVELRRLRISAVHSLAAVAGGAVAGAGIGSATFAAVGALATASTGTAISSLSGAAATSATLAWLGGGSLAAGGGGVAAGTTVLTGIIAAPVVIAVGGVVEWQGRRARAGQRETATQISEAADDLGRAETDAALVRRRSRQVRDILNDLRVAMTSRLPVLDTLITANPDYTTYSNEQRRQVAQLVGIASKAVTVMSTPIAHEDGKANPQIREVVLDVKQWLLALSRQA